MTVPAPGRVPRCAEPARLLHMVRYAVRPPVAADRIHETDDGRRPKSRASWTLLLKMVFEVDPLTCLRCGAPMRVIAVITAPALIDRLLNHVRGKAAGHGEDPFDARAPPAAQGRLKGRSMSSEKKRDETGAHREGLTREGRKRAESAGEERAGGHGGP